MRRALLAMVVCVVGCAGAPETPVDAAYVDGRYTPEGVAGHYSLVSTCATCTMDLTIAPGAAPNTATMHLAGTIQQVNTVDCTLVGTTDQWGVGARGPVACGMLTLDGVGFTYGRGNTPRQLSILYGTQEIFH